MYNNNRKKRIKTVIIIVLTALLVILIILIASKKVANPITKNSEQRAQFFVDLGNLLPKKKDVIHNGTTDDQNGNNTATSTSSGMISNGGGSTNTTIVYTPTKDTNGDGKVTNQDAVLDTNGDGTVSSEDTPAEVLNDQQVPPEEPSGPTPIKDNKNNTGGVDTSKDTKSTKDLIITSRQAEGVIKGTINLDWSSPTKANFTACTGSYAGGVTQQTDLKKKKIKLTALAQKTIYDWDGQQLEPTIPRSKKVHVPYGDKEIIYVITCDKEIVTVLPPDLPTGIPTTPVVSGGARVPGGLSGAPSTSIISTSGSKTTTTSCPPTPPGTIPVPCTPSIPSVPTVPSTPSLPTVPSTPGAPTTPTIPGTTLPPGAPALPKTKITIEKVTAQVAISLTDGTKNGNGSGTSTGNKTCADYPKSVSDLMPECNSNADDTKDLLLVAPSDTIAKGEKINLTWFSPSGTEFWFCTGTGGADAGLPSTTLSWVFTKLPPTPTDPVHQFEEVLDGRLKTVTYGLSCTTKSGKVVLSSASVQVIDDTNGSGNGTGDDFCDGLPDDLKKLYCPDSTDVAEIPEVDNNASSAQCAYGTAGQNTPLVLIASEQEEYDKLLRQFFRLLPQIRTPEAIVGLSHSIEEIGTTKKYVTELTGLCREQTQRVVNGDGASIGIPNPSLTPMRRLAPFDINPDRRRKDGASDSALFRTDQDVVTNDLGQDWIMGKTNVNNACSSNDNKKRDTWGTFAVYRSGAWGSGDGNHPFGLYTPSFNRNGDFTYDPWQGINPRADNFNEVFNTINSDKKDTSGAPWQGMRDVLRDVWHGEWWSKTGIGLNCESDGSDPRGQTGEGLFNYDSSNACQFTSEFEHIFGIKE